MHGAFAANANIAGQAPDQEFTDLVRTPMGLLPLEGEDQAVDRRGRWFGVAQRSARPIGERLKPVILCTRSCAKSPTRGRSPSWAAVEKAGDKPWAFVHNRSLLARHAHLPLPKKADGATHVSGTICHSCHDLSLVSRSVTRVSDRSSDVRTSRRICCGGSDPPFMDVVRQAWGPRLFCIGGGTPNSKHASRTNSALYIVIAAAQ